MDATFCTAVAVAHCSAGTGRRPPRLGQLRRQQAGHRQRQGSHLEVREPACDHHRAGFRQGLDGDPGAHIAHAEPRGAGRARGGRQGNLGFWLSFQRREG